MLLGQLQRLMDGSTVFEAGVHVGDDLLLMAQHEPRLFFVGVKPDLAKIRFVERTCAVSIVCQMCVSFMAWGSLDSVSQPGAVVRESHSGAWARGGSNERPTNPRHEIQLSRGG